MATMTRARPTPARSQHFSKPKGQARDLRDLALVALAPAISQMREAQNGMQATVILETMIPDHVRVPLAVYMVRHANNFDGEIVGAVLTFVGWEAIARSIGEAAAEAAFARHVAPLMNAVTA